ncbi:MAG: hemolysin III family protein [Cyclobacteriaceae bacterium]|nr:hemolysin III family protein [Cyclobacteriaceae bacterium]
MSESKIDSRATLEQELANSLTHGVGILFGVVAISLMVTFAVLYGGAIEIFAVSLFGGAVLLLYTFSTLYHAIQHPSTKKILRIFDHISIYFLIAGTYTPFLLIGLKGTLGWVMFGLVWTIAHAGMFFKVFYTARFPRLSLILYLGMGWIAVFMVKPLYETLDPAILGLILGGGAFYTLGTIFFVNKKLKYAHAIWHLFVLAGTITHFIGVMLLVQNS